MEILLALYRCIALVLLIINDMIFSNLYNTKTALTIYNQNLFPLTFNLSSLSIIYFWDNSEQA